MLNLDKFKAKEAEKAKNHSTDFQQAAQAEEQRQITFKTPAGFHVDPALEALIRKQTEQEAAEFEESVQKEGVREPILYWRHSVGHSVVETVVDGHHRLRAAQRQRIEYVPCRELHFASENEVRIWMLKNQLGRRNLSDAEKISIGLQLTAYLEEEAKRNQGHGVESEKIDRLAQVAELTDTSRRNVSKMKKIADSGDDALKAAVMAGEKSIHRGYEELKSREQEEEKKPTASKGKLYAEPVKKLFRKAELWKAGKLTDDQFRDEMEKLMGLSD
ncbi:ParB N-terminal domain-containing protein [Limibacter armeniacum]|uniref:ParB N-terminal domain-containing protein n=1 Tax=Limibacter armeniacum TaxID=466084 RepID=UPI002FE64713